MTPRPRKTHSLNSGEVDIVLMNAGRRNAHDEQEYTAFMEAPHPGLITTWARGDRVLEYLQVTVLTLCLKAAGASCAPYRPLAAGQPVAHP